MEAGELERGQAGQAAGGHDDDVGGDGVDDDDGDGGDGGEAKGRGNDDDNFVDDNADGVPMRMMLSMVMTMMWMMR